MYKVKYLKFKITEICKSYSYGYLFILFLFIFDLLYNYPDYMQFIVCQLLEYHIQTNPQMPPPYTNSYYWRTQSHWLDSKMFNQSKRRCMNYPFRAFIAFTQNKSGSWGEFQIYPVLYDNWFFLTLFLFPPKKIGKKKMSMKQQNWV